MSYFQARNRLVERIEHFIKERITVADRLIVENGLQKIQNGDVILTYAKSSVVEALLLEAKRSGYEFRVVVVDSRPMFEGKFHDNQPILDCLTHIYDKVNIC
jgi:translation initiation factor eIF-2B subunit delta